MIRYDYQKRDYVKMMDTSRSLTKLMEKWIAEAKCEDTDLGYDDWKAARRASRKVRGSAPLQSPK